MKNLVWFRNDLRLHDNPALSQACAKADQVVGIYIVTFKQWEEHNDSPNKIAFWFRSLIELQKDLHKLNIPLCILKCDTYDDCPQKILEFASANEIHNLYFNIEYPVNELKRDEQVQAVLEKMGTSCFSFHDQVIHVPGTLKTKAGTNFSVYSPFKRCWLAELDYALLEEHATPTIKQPVSVNQQDEYDLHSYKQSNINQDLWPVGEESIQKMIVNFLDRKGSDYKTDRNFPGLTATSMMSPYINSGVVSSKWCLNQARARNYDALDEGDKGLVHWISEILWREFYRHIIYNFPRVSMGKAFQEHFEQVPWENNQDFIEAWKHGRTGIPIVDAGMRQMIETGWMHNRLRMIVAMFLSKNLMVDWHIGEAFFMQHLIDGDIASNNGGWQWSASTGTDAAPYFRIMNPETQSLRFDEEGKYIRTFVNELSDCPTKEIHNPNNRSDYNYPEAIVDLKASRQKAIDIFGQIKK